MHINIATAWAVCAYSMIDDQAMHMHAQYSTICHSCLSFRPVISGYVTSHSIAQWAPLGALHACTQVKLKGIVVLTSEVLFEFQK